MWAQGDYPAVALFLEPCAIKLADRIGIRSGMALLDVAAGTGNLALAAAQRGARVTACDFTPNMIELGRRRTDAAGLDIEWVEGDAEALAFPDASYDVLASVFGAMFAPRPELVARELFRVCRPGGVVAMANYNVDGFLGGMADLFAKYTTPLPFELPSPFEWGDEAVVRRRFEGLASDVDSRLDSLTMSFESVDAGLEFWVRTNAPTIALRMTVPPERYAEYRLDARQLIEERNESRDGGVVLRSSYLSVLAHRII